MKRCPFLIFLVFWEVYPLKISSLFCQNSQIINFREFSKIRKKKFFNKTFIMKNLDKIQVDVKQAQVVSRLGLFFEQVAERLSRDIDLNLEQIQIKRSLSNTDYGIGHLSTPSTAILPKKSTETGNQSFRPGAKK